MASFLHLKISQIVKKTNNRFYKLHVGHLFKNFVLLFEKILAKQLYFRVLFKDLMLDIIFLYIFLGGLECVVYFFAWGHLDTSTTLLPMGLMSIGNIAMLF